MTRVYLRKDQIIINDISIYQLFELEPFLPDPNLLDKLIRAKDKWDFACDLEGDNVPLRIKDTYSYEHPDHYAFPYIEFYNRDDALLFKLAMP